MKLIYHGRRSLAVTGAVLVAVAGTRGATAQPTSPPDAMLRQEVEAVWAEARRPPDPQREEPRIFYDLSDRLIVLGSPVVPFLAAELDLPSVHTFNIAAYAAGRVGGQEAVAALRQALERAEAEGGKWGRARKIWAAFGLALAGDVEGVRALERGLKVWREELTEGMSLLELAAMLTYPDSLPILLEQLERLPEQEEWEEMLVETLRALARFAEPATVKRILPFLNYRHPRVRAQAALTLGHFDDPELVKQLLPLLDDEDAFVRSRAAMAIERLPLGQHRRAVLGRLEISKEAEVRAALFRALARTGDDSLVEAFRSHWGDPDEYDRLGLVQALTRLNTPRALNLLRAAARDRSVVVANAAGYGLAKLATPGARDTLLALLRDPRWPVRQATLEYLVTIRETRAASRAADMLLRGELDEPLVDMEHVLHVEKLGEALVAFGYTEPLESLRAAAERQSAPWIRSALDRLVRRLEMIAARGEDLAAWSEATGSDDPELRRLAYQRLAWIGNGRSVPALRAAFERAADPEERVEILRTLATLAPPEAADFAETLLADTAYDTWEQRHVRAMAAWLARRLGTERMAQALETSARRRVGRDADVLVYLAVLRGRKALPLLRELRLPRLAYLEWTRGAEDERLAWIMRELEAGRSLAELDAPPDEIALEPW